jgi:heme/copper-type cytochrome/quinol oxidase subunit 2
VASRWLRIRACLAFEGAELGARAEKIGADGSADRFRRPKGHIPMSHYQHLTTRRTFITTLGFGGVALYGAWAGYGAAPLPIMHSLGQNAPAPSRQGEATPAHGGHAAAGTVTPEEFLRRHEEFMARFSQPDGSVALTQVRASAPSALPQRPAIGNDIHATSQTLAGGQDVHGFAQHGAADAGQPQAPTPGDGSTLADFSMMQPMDLYLLAYRFGFTPDDIRIEAGKPYRIRMMASDITHGASLQLGRGSRIIRLRPKVVSELTITFNRPGRVLIYCTVFCGPAHDAMKARILVA